MVKRKRVILSLDIGSSSCKAMLLDEYGMEFASGRGEYPIHYTGQQGEVEQKPDELWLGVCEAIGGLLKEDVQSLEIEAISLSSQMSSYFLVDRENRPLCNVISWMDTRAVTEAEEMKESFAQEELFRLLGAELPVGPSWPIPKLRWMSRHLSKAMEKAKYIVQPKEWIVWNLTGVWRTDVSSVRGMVHQTSGVPAHSLFAWAGAASDLLPPIGDPFAVVGPLRSSAAQLLSLPEGIPVILGWNDINAAVLGAVGATGQVCGFNITGTSEHIGIVSPRMAQPQIASQGTTSPEAASPWTLSPAHASGKGINWLPFERQHEIYYGVTSSGGQALKWFVEQVDQFHPLDQSEINSSSEKSEYDYESTLSHAEAIQAGSEGVLFLPYLNGERSPWWNPSARGVFFGLHYTHDRRHMARAVLEGVGYALRTITDRLPSAPERFISAGGSGRFPLWNRIKANILGVPICCLETTEAGCLGAAILAAYGLGWYDSLAQASIHMIRTRETYEPDPLEQSRYDHGYGIFIELYHTLVPIFDKQGRI